MEREHRGTLERVPRTPQNFSELSGCPESALLHGSGLFLSFCHGGYRVAGVPLRCPTGACLFGCPPILPLACFPAPSPRPRSQSALPSGKGEIFNFLMQGASPLASPGLNRRGHRSRGANHAPSGGLSPAARGGWGVGGAQGGACLFGRLLTLPSVCFLSPIPPTPFPAGRGCPKVYFAGGFAPGTPAAVPVRCWRWVGRWRPAGGLLQRRGKVNLGSSNPAEAAKPILQHPASQPPCRSAREGWNRARTLVFNNNNSFGKVLGGSGDSFKSPPAYPRRHAGTQKGWNRARAPGYGSNNSFGKVLGVRGDSFKSPPAYLPVSPYLRISPPLRV